MRSRTKGTKMEVQVRIKRVRREQDGDEASAEAASSTTDLRVKRVKHEQDRSSSAARATADLALEDERLGWEMVQRERDEAEAAGEEEVALHEGELGEQLHPEDPEGKVRPTTKICKPTPHRAPH